MTHTNYSKLTPADVARILFRHARMAMFLFCLVLAMTVGWIVLAPREYESRAKVYVRVGHELNTLDPSATTGQTVNIEQTLEAELNSMLAIVESRETAERVVADIGAETILANDLPDDSPAGDSASAPPSESTMTQLKNMVGDLKDKVLPSRFDESEDSRAIRALRKGATIWSPAKSNIIEISYKARHPLLAQEIVQSWTDAFIKEHLRVTRTEGSHYFFVHKPRKSRSSSWRWKCN